jgi:CHAT domain
MSQRPPRTSYGYLAPAGAKVNGWECNNEGCGTGDRPVPRSWPALCPNCKRPVDPSFEEPWAHRAKGVQLRYQQRDPASWGTFPSRMLLVWNYKDALLRQDSAAMETAMAAYRDVKLQESGGDLWLAWEFVTLALGVGDLDFATLEVLDQYRFIRTDDVEDDSTQRTDVRTFVSLCAKVLKAKASVGHQNEAAVDAAMRDVARRAETAMNPNHAKDFQDVGEVRAFKRSHDAIVRNRRSLAAIHEELPPFGQPVRETSRYPQPSLDAVADLGSDPKSTTASADFAAAAAHAQADVVPLDRLIQRLEQTGSMPGLMHLLCARRRLVADDPRAALRELDLALKARDPFTRQWLQPQIHATKGLLLARINRSGLNAGIDSCREGRRTGLRWWRRVTAADPGLARLLLWRASQSTDRDAKQTDIHSALKLANRRCRPWHAHGVGDLLLRQEAIAAAEALSERDRTRERHLAWIRLTHGPWSTSDRARVAAAWAEWALDIWSKEYVAEAYRQLVTLVAQDSATRYTAVAKQRVLAAAQEYAEEAGYWLARSERYREAVLALETGRAVGLTEALGQGSLAVAGADPLIPSFGYADITAETSEGAIVYIAAAKAGGYALIVAADHEPQFVDIPKLDHASVAALVNAVAPATAPPSRGADSAWVPSASEATVKVRDAMVMGTMDDSPANAGLRTLWTGGISQLLFYNARGRIVTFIPVGLLSLLPLHAAGEPWTLEDPYSEGRHAGHLSAIRYAPNVRALRRCRDTARELAQGGDSLLALDVPNGFGLDARWRLEHVAHETDAVAGLWAGQAAQSLHGCTWEAFLHNAENYSVWHFACHGSANALSIMDTRLFFADREVSLAQLRDTLKPGRRRLAVLSACDTNLTATAVPNEVVGLPSALIQVGFAGVVAAAWKVDDLATAYLMTEFYHQWRQEGATPPIALNRAQRWLRAATRTDLAARIPEIRPPDGPGDRPYLEPRYWAAFAYTGA